MKATLEQQKAHLEKVWGEAGTRAFQAYKNGILKNHAMQKIGSLHAWDITPIQDNERGVAGAAFRVWQRTRKEEDLYRAVVEHLNLKELDRLWFAHNAAQSWADSSFGNASEGSTEVEQVRAKVGAWSWYGRIELFLWGEVELAKEELKKIGREGGR